MKFTWEANDIRPGKLVCVPPNDEARSQHDKCCQLAIATYLISAVGGSVEKDRFALVSIPGGAIGLHCTAEAIADHLNKKQMIPMPHKWFMALTEWMTDCFQPRFKGIRLGRNSSRIARCGFCLAVMRQLTRPLVSNERRNYARNYCTN